MLILGPFDLKRYVTEPLGLTNIGYLVKVSYVILKSYDTYLPETVLNMDCQKWCIHFTKIQPNGEPKF